ncbi:MAG: hypothetical protein ACYSTF_05920 [Planctomycetota bacterium]|jgi:tetratricopeptide (TPR) repeat protein
MVLAADVPDELVGQVVGLISEWFLGYWRQAVITASEWFLKYWWLAVITAPAYVYATWSYWRRSRESDDSIRLAPISVKGGLAKELGSCEVGLLLRGQLDAITETFRKATGSNVSEFAAEAVSAEFPSINAALVDVSLMKVSSELRLKEDLVVAIGPVKIPVNAIIDLFVALLRVLPVLFRRRCLASLFHVSVVSVENETQLLVYRKGPRPIVSDSSQQKVMGQSGSWPMLLARSGQIKGITDFNDLLRDAAFMLLQMHGGFEGRNWLGMRYFADGLDALDKYRLTSKDKLLKSAKESFGLAVAADSENYEAAYFYGYMLLFERTRESIATAIQLFGRVVKTEDKKLKALAKTGLAHCYVQQFHRLAKREDNLLAKAGELVEEAGELWKEATEKKTAHRLILYTRALSMIADEGKDKPDKEVKKRFLAAACLLLEAIEKEPDNAMFFNTLGWLFLKLAQRGIKSVVAKDGISAELVGSTAERSEHYTRVALDLYPQNKLSHANLCLLFATPRYLDEKKEGKKDEYLIRCRYHGLRAVQLDRKYINGYRDLAQSLIRYKKFEEAEKYFKKALRYAAVVDKDLEIIEDTVKVLKKIDGGEEWLKRFGHPDSKLLEPP